MLVHEGLELLTQEEALELIPTREVGRVGITIGALPAIFPVNFRWVDGAVVFRTSPGSKLHAASSDEVVAFEVDDFDAADRSGWSVLIVGRATVIEDPGLVAHALAAGLEPYADGPRTSLVRIEPGFVSGRRIVHEPIPSPAPPAG